MDAHVPVQLSAVLERSATNLTLVRSLLRVDPPMDLQIFLHAKHLMAKFTLERSLAGVRAIVTYEPCRHSKRFLAHITLVRVGLLSAERSGACPSTAGHCRRVRKLGTGDLFTRCLLLLFGMRFHMAGVSTFAAKAYVALFATELGADCWTAHLSGIGRLR
uniref:Uncharacterized protein n=1 Tax=Anopheles maculatus TaxID=74869 RepID=A0A182T2T5_9DIPT